MNENVARLVRLQKHVANACKGGGVVGIYADEVVLSKKSMGWLPQQWTVKLIKSPAYGFTHEATTIVDGVKFKVFLTLEEWHEIFGVAGG